jgi:cyclic-di-GMP-binding protein
MAQESSFDIVSKLDPQEVDNAVNQACKEIATRFDFKGSKSAINFDKTKKELLLESDDEVKLQSVVDILHNKLVKRGVSLKALDYQVVQPAAAGTVRQIVKMNEGIPQEKAKKVAALIKDAKFKVQVSIQGDQLRVSGKSKDELQAVMAKVRGSDIGFDPQFTNFK